MRVLMCSVYSILQHSEFYEIYYKSFYKKGLILVIIIYYYYIISFVLNDYYIGYPCILLPNL